jgi:hypothetical protein
MAPVLYLRSWEADQIHMRGPALRRGFVEHFAPPPRISFAELVGVSAELLAPVLATGQPGGRRLPGMASLWSSDKRWHDNVRGAATNSLCVVMTAGPVPPGAGYSWEVELLGIGETTQRLVIVFPPNLTVSEARRPGGFLDSAATLPLFQGLAEMELSDETLVLARARGHAWKAYTSGVRTDGSYFLAFTDALDHFMSSWEEELLNLDDRRSTDRIVRESTLEEGSAVLGVVIGYALGAQRFVSALWHGQGRRH